MRRRKPDREGGYDISTLDTQLAAPQVTVRVLKYNGDEYRHWTGRITRRDGPLIVIEAEFDLDVSHHQLGDIKRGTRTIEYYWLDRRYNILRFLDDGGSTRLYYCNVNMLPTVTAGVLSYVDLDIDILVQPDLSYQLLDM